MSDIRFRDSVTVADPHSLYYGWAGSVVSARDYSVEVEFPGRGKFDPRTEYLRSGRPKPISFAPAQLKVLSRATNWKPPAMPWDKEES